MAKQEPKTPVEEVIQRLRIVGAKVHADDGRLEVSQVPAFASPLAARLKRQHKAAVAHLLSARVQVWIDALEEPIWLACDPETAQRYQRVACK